KHKKLIEQPGIAEFMHLVNGFPRIQPLRDPGIISARQLPVESFLHDACFFGCLGDCWLTLHTVVPLPFFLSLSLSPLPHNLLYQNTSTFLKTIDAFPKPVILKGAFRQMIGDISFFS